MQIRIFLVFSLLIVSCFSLGQEVLINSEELNQLIWQKINARLLDLGKTPIMKYENEEMKDFGFRTCQRLIEMNDGYNHSPNDSISKYSGGECFYVLISESTGENSYIKKAENKDFESLAKLVFDGWVGSDSHRRAISMDWYSSTTVASLIKYDQTKGYFKLVATWYEKD